MIYTHIHRYSMYIFVLLLHGDVYTHTYYIFANCTMSDVNIYGQLFNSV